MRSELLAGIELKLVPKEQWYCDKCGEIIEKSADAMLEWDSLIEPDQEGRTAKNFRIVHHQVVKNCQTKGGEVSLADGHLDWYIGPDGLNELLDLSVRYNVDVKELNDIIRRLHIEFYEEAMPYMNKAKEEDPEIYDPNETGDYPQRDLIGIIKKYS